MEPDVAILFTEHYHYHTLGLGGNHGFNCMIEISNFHDLIGDGSVCRLQIDVLCTCFYRV